MDLVLGGLAVSLLIVFLGAFRAILRAREGEAGALSATTVIAGSVLAAAALVAGGSDDFDTALLAFPAATMLVAASLGILSTRALPRSVAYAGFAAAVLQLVAVASEWVALAALAAWAALTSLAMLRQRAG